MTVGIKNFFSCDGSSIRDNVRLSVGWMVRPSATSFKVVNVKNAMPCDVLNIIDVIDNVNDVDNVDEVDNMDNVTLTTWRTWKMSMKWTT